MIILIAKLLESAMTLSRRNFGELALAAAFVSAASKPAFVDDAREMARAAMKAL